MLSNILIIALLISASNSFRDSGDYYDDDYDDDFEHHVAIRSASGPTQRKSNDWLTHPLRNIGGPLKRLLGGKLNIIDMVVDSIGSKGKCVTGLRGFDDPALGNYTPNSIDS